MASQGQTIGPEPQAIQVTDISVCATCGVEWFSNQKLLREVSILQSQHDILNDQLFRAGHVNQVNEFRIRSLHYEAAANLQKRLDTQKGAFDAERRQNALVVESLKHECSRHEEAEKRLEHERTTVHKLTDFLNQFALPSQDGLCVGLPRGTGLGTLFHEWESTKSEVRYLRYELQRRIAELQQKQLLLENLSGKFEVEPQSRSETSFSISDGPADNETAE